VQEFASKSGAINLVTQFNTEETLPLKDAMFGSLSSWIKADNFEGKRRFIEEQQGLEFLTSLVCDANVNANFNLRLKKKIMNLIADLVLNDDGIYDQHPYHVRQYFSTNEAFLMQLIGTLATTDLNNMQELQYRDSILIILFRLHQYKAEVVGPVAIPILQQHKAALQALMASP